MSARRSSPPIPPVPRLFSTLRFSDAETAAFTRIFTSLATDGPTTERISVQKLSEFVLARCIPASQERLNRVFEVCCINMQSAELGIGEVFRVLRAIGHSYLLPDSDSLRSGALARPVNPEDFILNFNEISDGSVPSEDIEAASTPEFLPYSNSSSPATPNSLPLSLPFPLSVKADSVFLCPPPVPPLSTKPMRGNPIDLVRLDTCMERELEELREVVVHLYRTQSELIRCIEEERKMRLALEEDVRQLRDAMLL